MNTSSTDADLIAAAASVIDEPKHDPPNSFVLHAPLELLARAILLERVSDSARESARARINWLADTYAAAGPAAETSPSLHGVDLDRVNVSLAAAGHAPILWSLRARVSAVAGDFGERLVATEVGRYPDWNLVWPAERDNAGAPTASLEERLASPRSPGDPGSDFIFPTMHLTESSGLSAEVLEDPLRGLDVAGARRSLLRVAAQSMLQDNRDAAPYGWTHCLTMPQAVLNTADHHGANPRIALGVAATYVLGFRATQGKVRLDPSFVPALDSAAGQAWTTQIGDRAELVEALADRAAIHPDAHLTKYTLACFDAAEDDPDAAHLFLAAAAYLQEWWEPIPFDDDPIIGRR